MIIIRITSGLGNQLFQYATARSIANRYKTIVKIDTIHYYIDKQRSFALDSFQIPISKVTITDLLKIYPFEGILLILLKPFIGRKKTGKLILWLEQKIFKYQAYYNKPLANKQTLIKKNILIQRYYHFDEEIINAKDNIYMIGYFQSWKYFNNIKSILIEEIKLKKTIRSHNKGILQQITNCDSVSVHIRRGDYFSDANNRKLFEVFDMHYFVNAIQMMKQKLTSPVFFIFSDDIEWVKKNFQLSEHIVFFKNSKGDKPAEDLILMSNCKHNIISNSSFSWWGAWLNQNPGKIVIAPKKWLNSEEYDTKDLLPPDWIKI
jgi:hypothetical protein